MIPPNTLLQNRYLVLEQIGKGGMGVVYRATDQRFGSTVALKEIFLDAPHLRKAFEREARLLNHLRHPALPRVSDHFNDEDGQFIVMEFIPGADLWEMLKEKRVPFSLSNVLDWADQLLDALDYLHNHEPSIIHRDIKPQNLKLTERNRIVLLDFGLAKGTPSQASRVTEAASVFGYSYHYAPLEQMQGTGTDVRSDLYSLAATLYHLMTNVAPPDALSRATAVLNGEADPLRPADKVQAQVSEPVARVLMHAMAQSAAKRPPSAAAMREALREAAKQTSAAAPSPFVQPVAAVGTIEQYTELAGARSTAPLTEDQSAGVAAAPYDVLTVVQPELPAGERQPLRARRRENESVVTRIRPAAQTPAPQPPLSAFKITIIASAVLVAIAAAIFIFLRPPQAKTASVESVQSSGDPATLPSVSPAAVETQASAPQPQSATMSAPSQQAANQPNDSTQSSPVSSGPNSQPATTDSAAASQPKTQDAQGRTDSGSPALTPEAERARQADEIRRQRREQDEAYIKREREETDRQREREALERQQREMIRREPPPPPPGGFPPPPRGGGPPPH